MPDFTPQQLTFADYLYRMLEAGRRGPDSVVVVIVGEDQRVKKVIEEKPAVICALSTLRDIEEGEVALP